MFGRCMSACLVFITAGIAALSPQPASTETLEGRLITFKRTFDGWWDLACDTLADGSSPRCYAQYVDPYRSNPLRAAMVDFVYRATPDGTSEPVITFDLEPDLSFARDAKIHIIGRDGRENLVPLQRCHTGRCVFSGRIAREMLRHWSDAKALRLRITERSREVIVRRWPLENMAEMVRLMLIQRKARGLP